MSMTPKLLLKLLTVSLLGLLTTFLLGWNCCAWAQDNSVVAPSGAQLFSGKGEPGPDIAPAHGSVDKIEFDATVKPLPLDFQLNRQGDIFHAETHIPASKSLIEPGTSAAAARQLLFKQHDVVVIIDKSGSMRERDCPDAHSRWEWCRAQTADLAKAAELAGNSEGITVIVFSDDYSTYRNCGLDTVANIFHTHAPDGGTNTANALRSAINEYYMRSSWHSASSRPLVVAIITDGLPSQPDQVRNVIADTTRRMHEPDEVRVTFLQVGEDLTGYDFARDVDDNMIKYGATSDIVYSKTFDQLKQCGVTGALLDAITRHPAAPAAPAQH